MMRLRTVRGCALALALWSLSPVVAPAQSTIDVAKITCEQFLLFQVTDPDYIAAWLSGYYHAKQGTTVIDVQQLKNNANRVKEFCRANLQQTVMQVVETRMAPGK